MPFNPIDVEISSDHGMFGLAGVLSPMSKFIGQPILIYRHMRDDATHYIRHPERQNFDNQAVTRLMMDPLIGHTTAR